MRVQNQTLKIKKEKKESQKERRNARKKVSKKGRTTESDERTKIERKNGERNRKRCGNESSKPNNS